MPARAPDPPESRSSEIATEVVAEVIAIVPTLGRSPYLADCVQALLDEGLLVVVVAPGGVDVEGDVQVVRSDEPLGFAAATLLGLDCEPARSADWVALVNDDCIVQPGWAAALRAALDGPDAADVGSVQGLVTSMDRSAVDGSTVDGAGLAWNRWWQAIQVGRGQRVADWADRAPFETFGVSATAALYRRAALDGLERIFDRSFGSYYEDVDLAVRLRRAGWRALVVPAARAAHAGSVTGGLLTGTSRQIRRNRYPVLARLLGRSLWTALPRIVLRDLIDAARLFLGGRGREAVRVATGTVAGLARLPATCRTGPAVDTARWRTP